MDIDLISLILRGCNMAKDLESNLQTMTHHQLADSCVQLIRVFTEARERLSVGQDVSPSFNSFQMYTSTEGMNTTFHEYVARILQNQLMAGSGGRSSSSGLIEGSSSMPATGGSSTAGLVVELSGKDEHASAGAALDPAATASSSQRQRKRKEDGDKRTVMIPAPQSGNTEIPPDDGFTWRKYGQKEILGSKYPRGYYRCTHQKLYNCPAKKQVQRMDDKPSIYEVTYRGEHTCHKSATAPSVAPPPPPPPPEITSQHMTQALTAAATSQYQPLGEWLQFRLGGGDTGAAPSTSNVNRSADQFPVTDMADVMFNSGSSSSNSMEFIFSTNMEDKWPESGDKKN